MSIFTCLPNCTLSIHYHYCIYTFPCSLNTPSAFVGGPISCSLSEGFKKGSNTVVIFRVARQWGRRGAGQSVSFWHFCCIYLSPCLLSSTPLDGFLPFLLVVSSSVHTIHQTGESGVHLKEEWRGTPPRLGKFYVCTNNAPLLMHNYIGCSVCEDNTSPMIKKIWGFFSSWTVRSGAPCRS